MLVRTPADLGAVIRGRRKQLKLDQAALAKQIGVSRQWVIEMERGHAGAELALVLRALDALSIRLDAITMDQAGVHLRGSDAVDVDAIVRKAKKSCPPN
jgi:HTH-type transcriptional regulator/antitoxin HipB